MIKNEYLIPVIVIVLTVIFAFVSFAVFLSRGKSSFWLSKKMKLGALLITLTVATQQSCITKTCYAPTPVPYAEIDNVSYKDTLDVNIGINNKIPGTVYYWEQGDNDFWFSIVDTVKQNIIQSGKIMALDGEFDSGQEDFEIAVDTSIQTGLYNLNLHTNEPETANEYAEYTLFINIINED